MTNMRKRLFCLASAALCTALIAVCSYISIPVGNLYFTLQLAAVLFTAGFLPPAWAIGSVASYVLLGLIGVPVFAGFKSGFGAIAGPTGGFILGFLPAVAFAAPALYFLKKRISRRFLLYTAVFAGATLIVYICGTAGLCIYMPDKGLSFALTTAVLPYTGFDLVKILVAAFLCVRAEKISRGIS